VGRVEKVTSASRSLGRSQSISPALARRIALAAQGFGRSSSANPPAGPSTKPGTRQLNSLIARLGLLQIDSVNVFERSHYLPVFARLGQFDKADLDRLTLTRKGPYTEYLAHVACFIPLDTWPLWRWRMREFRAELSEGPDRWVHQNSGMLDWLRAELAEKGPLAASSVEHEANKRRGPWWGLSDVKIGLEYLFYMGETVSAGRTRFERIYGLTEQVIPARLLDIEISKADATRQLMNLAARAHGIGTLKDLADYYRLKQDVAKIALADLVDSGEVILVTVPGWKETAYLHRDARMPRTIQHAALLSPFDPVVWERNRALRMFGFHYRIEIYTPEPKRVFGYYSLPILVDEALVGRIDLKSDRQNRVLRVQSAWRETDAPAGIEERIVPLLESTREWQGLESVEFAGRGDLSVSLEAAWRVRDS
jgi:uncharacterized protein